MILMLIGMILLQHNGIVLSLIYFSTGSKGVRTKAYYKWALVELLTDGWKYCDLDAHRHDSAAPQWHRLVFDLLQHWL